MSDKPLIFVVDDDANVRDALCTFLQTYEFSVKGYASAHHFLSEQDPRGDCIIIDVRLPELSGLELQEELCRRDINLPVVVVTGHGDVPLAVRAMKAGAIDILEKPFNNDVLLASIRRALEIGLRRQHFSTEERHARNVLASLTPREKSVLEQLLKGNSNKVAAHELGISARTVEIHRANIMDKARARSLSDLVKIALAAQRLDRFGEHA